MVNTWALLNIKKEETYIYVQPPQQSIFREAHNYLAELIGRKDIFKKIHVGRKKWKIFTGKELF